MLYRNRKFGGQKLMLEQRHSAVFGRLGPLSRFDGLGRLSPRSSPHRLPARRKLPPPCLILETRKAHRAQRLGVSLCFDHDGDDGGALVTDVLPHGLAWRAGIRADDVVLSVIHGGTDHVLTQGTDLCALLAPMVGALRFRVVRPRPSTADIAATRIAAAFIGMLDRREVGAFRESLQAARRIQYAWKAFVRREWVDWAARAIQLRVASLIARQRQSRILAPSVIRAPPALLS